MSDEKLHFTAIGMLRPSEIGGDICENCPNNEHILSSALLTGGENALRDCASLIFSDCEIVQAGTKERINQLESENKRLRKKLPVWHTGKKEPGFMQESILIEVKSGGYRTGEFAGIHPLGYIRYNDFQGKTRIISKNCILRWAYVKDLKGNGK